MSLKQLKCTSLERHANLVWLSPEKVYNTCQFDPEKRNPKTKVFTQFGLSNCSDSTF